MKRLLRWCAAAVLAIVLALVLGTIVPRPLFDAAANTGMSKWTLTGTAPDGVRKEVRGCDFYSFRDGKVIAKDSYWKIVE